MPGVWRTAIPALALALVTACSKSNAPPDVAQQSASDRDTGAAQETAGAAGGASHADELAHDAGGSPSADRAGLGRDAAMAVETDAGVATSGTADAGAAAELDCAFTGEPRIEPADSEFSTPQRFSLEGISELPEGCVRYAIDPDSYSRYGSGKRDSIDFDPATGELATSRLRNNTVFEVTAFVAGEPVATTAARYLDGSDPLHGLYEEIAVLRCPDHAEEARDEVGELRLTGDLTVTFHPFETYTDYEGQYTWTSDPDDPRRGQLELSVATGEVPDSFDPSGSFYARPDGLLELRDLWLGPGDAQCGHVFERIW